jgi:hypothetical protein
MTYLSKAILIIIALNFTACTNEKPPEVSIDMDALNQLLDESEKQITVKKVDKTTYLNNIKNDLPIIIDKINNCMTLSKNNGTSELSIKDTASAKGIQGRIEDIYEKYVMERTEENPMLIITLKEEVETNWVSLVSLAHNVCLSFSKYFPKSKNARAFAQDYKTLSNTVYKNFTDELDKFKVKYNEFL